MWRDLTRQAFNNRDNENFITQPPEKRSTLAGATLRRHPLAGKVTTLIHGRLLGFLFIARACRSTKILKKMNPVLKSALESLTR